MKTLHTTTHVGPGGDLNLSLLVPDLAGKDVEVAVSLTPIAPGGNPLNGQSAADPEEWKRFVEQTAGKWVGEFVRPEQGKLEERDEWQ